MQEQAKAISSFEIVSGGAMRKQSGANKNQSTKSPASTNFLFKAIFISADSKTMAKNKPLLRIDLILS